MKKLKLNKQTISVLGNENKKKLIGGAYIAAESTDGFCESVLCWTRFKPEKFCVTLDLLCDDK